MKKEGHRISCRFTRATTRTILFVRRVKNRSDVSCHFVSHVVEWSEVKWSERGESRETKAKIGSRVLKLQPLSGRDVSMAVSRRPGEKEREGRRRGERWTDRCLEAILVSSCAFRMSASKVERVLCARKAAHPTKFMSRKIRA